MSDDSTIFITYLILFITFLILFIIGLFTYYHFAESTCQTKYDVADCTWIMVPSTNWENYLPPLIEEEVINE